MVGLGCFRLRITPWVTTSRLHSQEGSIRFAATEHIGSFRLCHAHVCLACSLVFNPLLPFVACPSTPVLSSMKVTALCIHPVVRVVRTIGKLVRTHSA
jgi:hypothetical protein